MEENNTLMMQKFSRCSQIGLIILSIFWFGSCAEEGIIEETPRVTIPEPQELVSSTLYGQVLDEDDIPIDGAQVSYRSGLDPLLIETDDQGYFLIEDVDNKGRAAFLSITHPGKFEAFRKFSLVPNRYNYTEIKMMNREIIGSIDASDGGSVSQADGASVTLPANGVIARDGSSYSGNVDVALAWIDPSSEDLAQRMVGDLSGIDQAGNPRSLNSFGMLQVELIGSDGSLLNLGQDQLATLSFPIPASMQGKASNTIPLWSYDEIAGTWIQEGEAQLNGDTYIGQVSHFSSWNVDHMTDPIEITGQIKWEVEKSDGDTVVGGTFLQVYVCSDNIGRKGGWLCDDGSFRFYNFPKDEEFKLKVLDKCGNVIFQETYGPFSNDEDLGMIVVENGENSIVRIAGNAVNCNGDPVSNGVVIVSQGEDSRTYPLNDNGEFELGYDYCTGFDIGVEVIDLDEIQGSGEQIVANGASNAEFVDLKVCGELENFVSISIDGNAAQVLTPYNYFEFSNVFIADTTGTENGDTLFTFALVHETETNTNRSVFSIIVNFPPDYETDPNFDFTNIDIADFNYSTENASCELVDGQGITISFTAFNITSGGSISGTYQGIAKCAVGDLTQYQEVSVSGAFKIPIP